MTYDYFYGQQAEMFAFYRVPKVFFDVTFNDAIGEIAGNDERYAELQSVADEAVHTLAGIVGKSNTALWEQCEHTINSLYTLQLQLVKLAYLRGA